MEILWCSVCGGQHERPVDCPGDLRAMGVERHGWRVVVDTPYGVEVYGVLVAQTVDRWRARILTYPNVLWTVPGGQASVKFTGSTAQAAEAAAVAFVEGHIRARGYRRSDKPEPPAVSGFKPEVIAKVATVVNVSARKLRAVPVRFGVPPNFFSAMTGNVSESGLFVISLAPVNPGAGVTVLVSLDSGSLGLKGKVVWKRDKPQQGRPVGMGVQLIAPPAPYRNFVSELP